MFSSPSFPKDDDFAIFTCGAESPTTIQLLANLSTKDGPFGQGLVVEESGYQDVKSFAIRFDNTLQKEAGSGNPKKAGRGNTKKDHSKWESFQTDLAEHNKTYDKERVDNNKLYLSCFPSFFKFRKRELSYDAEKDQLSCKNRKVVPLQHLVKYAKEWVGDKKKNGETATREEFVAHCAKNTTFTTFFMTYFDTSFKPRDTQCTNRGQKHVRQQNDESLRPNKEPKNDPGPSMQPIGQTAGNSLQSAHGNSASVSGTNRMHQETRNQTTNNYFFPAAMGHSAALQAQIDVLKAENSFLKHQFNALYTFLSGKYPDLPPLGPWPQPASVPNTAYTSNRNEDNDD